MSYGFYTGVEIRNTTEKWPKDQNTTYVGDI